MTRCATPCAIVSIGPANRLLAERLAPSPGYTPISIAKAGLSVSSRYRDRPLSRADRDQPAPGFAYPSAPVPYAFNVLSKILAFVTALCLFLPQRAQAGTPDPAASPSSAVTSATFV
jgi:hypothetical protein